MSAAARARWVPYAIVLAVGLLFASGAALGADRQPFVWAVPPLVLTVVALAMFAISDRRAEERAVRTTADALDLRDTGLQTLPTLTPVLQRAEPARMLAGELADGAPARLARVRGLAVCITDAPDRSRVAADPHGVLDAETTAPTALADWAATHPLRPGVVAEGGTLVVATRLGRGEEPPYEALLEAAVEARSRG